MVKQNIIQRLLIAVIFFANVAVADDADMQTYVHKLMNESLAVLNDDTLDHHAKTGKVKEMLAANMDATWMARFTLGRLIKTSTEAQANNFIEVYKLYMISSYANAVSQYKGEKVEIDAVQNMGEEFSIVKTRVCKSDGNTINVNYLVHKVDGQYRVCDVITEGISLINSQRAEYSSVIASQGIDVLIEDLRNKTK